jgi:hypothetical protein
MTKKMIFVFGVGAFFCFVFFYLLLFVFLVFCFHMDSLALNDMTLILGFDMNVNVSIETHVTYDKPFILTDSEQNLRIIFLKLETQ